MQSYRRILIALTLIMLPVISWGQSLTTWIDFDRYSVAPGEHVSTRVWVFNNGGSSAENTEVTVTIPEYTRVWAGNIIPSGTPTSGYQTAGETVTVDLGDVAVGDIRMISFPLLVLSDATVGDDTELMVDTSYSDPNNSTLDIVEPEGLQAVWSADKQVLVPGEEVFLTLNVANPAETGAARTEMRLTLSPDLEILTTTLPDGTVNGNNFVIDMGTVPGNSLSQYIIHARLADAAPTRTFLTATATVEPRDGGYAFSEFTLLSLESIPASVTVEAGEPYTFTVHNFDGSRLEDGTLYTFIPLHGRVWAANTQPVPTEPASGYVNATDAPLRWDLPDIYTRDPFMMQLPLASTSDSAYARSQRNVLVIDEHTAIPADTAWTNGVNWGGQLHTTLTAPEPIARGEIFTLKVHYGNVVEEDAEDVMAYLHLPDDVLLMHSSVPLDDLGNGLYTADIGDLRAGESDLLWLELRAGNETPDTSQFDFHVWIMDGSLSMKTGFARLSLLAYDNFPITANFSTSQLMQDPSGFFPTDLEITNTSNNPLTDVHVAINIPWNVRFWTSYATPVPSNGSGYANRYDSISWDIPVLQSGERSVISIPWNFTQNINGFWRDIQAVITTTEGYNSRVRVASVTHEANDLRLHIQPETSSVEPGNPVWLTLTYSNQGDVSALNPSITVQLPEGLTYLDSDIQPVQTDPFLRFNLSSMNGGDRGRIRILVDTRHPNDPGQESDDTTIFARIKDESVPVNSASAQTTLLIEDPLPLKLEVTGHRDSMDGRVWQVEAVLTNTSNEALEDILVWFHVPPGMNLDPDYAQPFVGSGGASSGTDPFSFMIDTLPPGEPYLVSLPFLPASSFSSGRIVPMTIHAVDGDGQYARDTEHLVYETGTLRAEIMPLSDFAYGGQNLTYRIYVGNLSNENRESVILRANVPTTVDFISAGSGGIEDNQTIRWDIGTIPAGAVAYVETTVFVPNSIPTGTIFQTEAYVTDSESPRNSARAVTSIPVVQGEPTINMDVQFEDDMLTYSYTNNLGQELASSRFWFSMPRYVRLSSDTGLTEREPFIWDQLNVVSDVPQEFTDEVVPISNPLPGNLVPFTAGVQSNLIYGAYRRFVLPISNEIYEVSGSGLNPAILQMWSDAERYDGGWVRSTWYGWFLDEDWPWIIHAEHNYQYPIYTEFGLYLYDFLLGTWLFTSQTLYFSDPNLGYLYFYDGAEWALLGFYRGGTAPNRWFYHYGPGFDRAINESELKTLIDYDQ